MKLTNKQLRQIIKEELEAVMREGIDKMTKVDGYDVYYTTEYRPKYAPGGRDLGVGQLFINVSVGNKNLQLSKELANGLMIKNEVGKEELQKIEKQLRAGDYTMWDNIWKLGKLTQASDGSFFSSFDPKNQKAYSIAMDRLK